MGTKREGTSGKGENFKFKRRWLGPGMETHYRKVYQLPSIFDGSIHTNGWGDLCASKNRTPRGLMIWIEFSCCIISYSMLEGLSRLRALLSPAGHQPTGTIIPSYHLKNRYRIHACDCYRILCRRLIHTFLFLRQHSLHFLGDGLVEFMKKIILKLTIELKPKAVPIKIRSKKFIFANIFRNFFKLEHNIEQLRVIHP